MADDSSLSDDYPTATSQGVLVAPDRMEWEHPNIVQVSLSCHRIMFSPTGADYSREDHMTFATGVDVKHYSTFLSTLMAACARVVHPENAFPDIPWTLKKLNILWHNKSNLRVGRTALYDDKKPEDPDHGTKEEFFADQMSLFLGQKGWNVIEVAIVQRETPGTYCYMHHA